MLLGYIRPDGRHPADAQRAILAAFRLDGKKIEKQWEDKRDDATYPERARLANNIRKRDDIVVVTHFHRLAEPGDDLKAAIAQLCKRHCITILETSTMRRVDCNGADGIAMTIDAMQFKSKRGLDSDAARRVGKTGTENSPVTKPKTGHMPLKRISAIMDDHETYSSVLSAIAAVKRISKAEGFEWWPSRDTIYRWKSEGKLQFTDRPSGRKRKK
jgi:hypothetical protein